MTDPGKRSPPRGPGFEPTLHPIATAAILPVKHLPTSFPKGRKYAQIAASIREAGLIDPLGVARARDQDGTFILLDGHVRLHVLKEIGHPATEDTDWRAVAPLRRHQPKVLRDHKNCPERTALARPLRSRRQLTGLFRVADRRGR
ncbi:ParB N-terminal domain-containing protein [Rhodovulum visakhapatnamense]|uniref:ParB-like nuclease family protein n=1 Tax=Rhodovulum visakhapatnamense TaxID=364297 RepID=A0A4R8FRA3_9RHOB|nr:ParB N-terminal domain-containing protein [Rhodovulum visakhapatnamense]TDX28860.1 ParB-like nuclease family protein [Rhodovulum visakhapatnamense]